MANNLTRIKNNQITDSTITSAKLATGTLVGTNFSNNLTLNSNVTIIGNLSVGGNTSTINSVNTYIQDPLITFNNGYTGSLTNYDIGIIVNRNWASLAGYGSVNTAFVWDENAAAFLAIATSTTGNAIVSLTNSGFANVKVGNLTSNSLTVSTGTIVATAGGVQNTPIGSITASTGAFTTLTNSGVYTSNGNLVAASGTASTNTTTGALVVVGGAGVSGNVNVGGLLNVSGNVTFSGIQASHDNGTITMYDSILDLHTYGNLAAWASDDGKDIGLRMHHYKGSDRLAFLGWENTTETLQYLQNAIETNSNVSGTFGNVQFGSLTLSNATSSTNTTSGALIVSGGVGVAGAIYAGSIQNTPIGSTTASTGAFTQLAGAYVNATTGFATANAVITGGSTTGMTNGTYTTLQATNFSTGNAVITGGSINNITTLQTTNFSTGNAVITGGYFTGTNVTATFGNVSSLIVTGNVTGSLIPSANITYDLGSSSYRWKDLYLNGTTIYLGSGQISTISGQITIANLSMTGYAVASNFSSSNILVTGGSINGTTVGASSASTGAFTTLSASGDTAVTSATQSTNTTTGALKVTGGVGIGGNLNVGGWSTLSGNVTIGGNLTVSGQSVSIGASTLSVNDPIINLNTPTDLSPLTVPTTDDIGLKFHYYDIADSAAFMGRANDTGFLEWYSRGSDVGNVFTSGTYGTIKTGEIFLANTTPSTSTATGAIRTSGGLGVAGNMYALGVNATNGNVITLVATNFSTGNAQITGGSLSGITNLAATTSVATNFSTGNAVITGGSLSGITNLASTTSVATNFSTGNAVITGGSTTGMTSGTYTTLQATNFSSGNITGTFNGTVTTLVATSNVALFSNVQTTSSASTFYPAFYNATTGNLASYTNSSLNFTPSTGYLYATGASIATVISTNINSTSIVATNGLSTANAVITGGSLNGTTVGATSASTGTFTQLAGQYVNATTGFATANAVITGGSLNGTTVGATTAAAGTFTTLTTTSTIKSTGNLVANATTPTTSVTTGALVVAGGAGFGANVLINTGANINVSKAVGADFYVAGANDNTIIWGHSGASYDSVIVGGQGNTATLATGAKFIVNSNDSMLLPRGDNAGRPGSTVEGMFRYSYVSHAIEWWNGTTWQSASTSFTPVTDQTITADGTSDTYTMTTYGTTAASMVSINGVIQIPTLAYSTFSGNSNIVFTEIPAASDIIDIRILTSTTSVSSIQSTTGKFQFVTDDTAGASVYTGSSGATAKATTIWLASGQQVSNIANVSVGSANTLTTVDTMDTTAYRSAKYIVQVTNGSSYQVQEALVISNGTTASIVNYGVVQTNGNLGVLTATQSGSNALVQFVAANASTTVRVSPTYLTI